MHSIQEFQYRNTLVLAILSHQVLEGVQRFMLVLYRVVLPRVDGCCCRSETWSLEGEAWMMSVALYLWVETGCVPADRGDISIFNRRRNAGRWRGRHSRADGRNAVFMHAI